MIKITIEEWAGDNNINLTNEQISELADAINICSEVELGSEGFNLGYKIQNDEEKEINNLKQKLQTLECFIRDKGLNISYGDKYVTEHYIERISDSHFASNDKTTKY